ncbi:endonuclease/exonuclease/phosphatase family protein [Microbacterium sp. ZW T6_19]|uniref:endonuclease/exonuclease/phosphatase family protein n=1 Tax=Microbacterium sp. ZW T6_19 TaxID=3378082 RepID=UPI003854646D
MPGAIGTAGAALLPWLGVALFGAVVLAIVFARRMLFLVLIPVVVWAIAIAPSLPTPATTSSAAPLTIVSQNVRAHSGGAGASAEELAASGADVIALVELDGDSLGAASEALAERYPHSYAVGTVGVWSRYPIVAAEPLTLGLDWKRALRVAVEGPESEIALYVLHAASVRPGHQDGRDTMLAGLARTVTADPADALVVVGDFNAASTDPAMNALRTGLDWVRPTDGSLGLTWPAAFPLTRIDQVFARGVTVLSSTTVHAGNSDHLATKTVVDG